MLSKRLIITSLSFVAACALGFFYINRFTQQGSTYVVTPKDNVNKVISKLKAGDTLSFKGGVYKQKLNVSVSGTNAKPIVLKAMDHQKVVIDGSKQAVSSDIEGLLTINDHSNLVVNGLTLQNFKSSSASIPAGIYVSGKSSNIDLENCDVSKIVNNNADKTKANAHGIAFYGIDAIANVTVNNCKVHNNQLGNSESMMFDGNVNGIKVTANQVYNNNNTGIDFAGAYGLAHKSDYARNIVCSGNHVWGISSKKNPSYEQYSADGIYIDGSQNAVIKDNHVNNNDIGIEAASENYGHDSKNIKIQNNVVYNCKAIAGISIGGYDSKCGGSRNVSIQNNTGYNNGELNVLVQAHAANKGNVITKNAIAKPAFDGTLTGVNANDNYISTVKNVKNAPTGYGSTLKY